MKHADLRIQALIEGLDANFENIFEIDEFVDLIKEILEENPHVDCTVVGDCDGLLISDKHDVPIITVIFNLQKIKFQVLGQPEDLENHQAQLVARSVLAVIGGLLSWYGDEYLETPPDELEKLSEPTKYTHPDAATTVATKSKFLQPGESIKFEFVNDGFGLC